MQTLEDDAGWNEGRRRRSGFPAGKWIPARVRAAAERRMSRRRVGAHDKGDGRRRGSERMRQEKEAEWIWCPVSLSWLKLTLLQVSFAIPVRHPPGDCRSGPRCGSSMALFDPPPLPDRVHLVKS